MMIISGVAQRIYQVGLYIDIAEIGIGNLKNEQEGLGGQAVKDAEKRFYSSGKRVEIRSEADFLATLEKRFSITLST